ncbi:NUDIX hydrolase [Ktedonospora formicarum]|uniref:Nudix hydrolase domain-containing protein n=1 Tax=Ktedonospora formicarum TaxID=2778364 RepID=A0A8J3I2J0_9CHLR|nr:NUDIX hydrolase [Ktedonospora formicarum]GHO44299.1 hypothetical protein KSX_24620 [Ktedonospora formicarum]
MRNFEILAQGCFSSAQVEISYQSEWRMPRTSDLEAWMDTLWEAKLTEARAQGKRLFDAPLFRLVGAESTLDNKLMLRLGDTSYKEYVTTREDSFARKHSREELGNAIGVCSVVETSDNYILLDKRQGVDAYEGHYHVIGGFFERGLDMDERLPDPFAAICREIREETGIQAEDIHSQYCLGAAYDMLMPHGELLFLTHLNIPLAEVLQREPEEDEIKELKTLHVSEASLKNFLLEHHGHISPTGEPNLLLYGALRYGQDWLIPILHHIEAQTLDLSAHES